MVTVVFQHSDPCKRTLRTLILKILILGCMLGSDYPHMGLSMAKAWLALLIPILISLSQSHSSSSYCPGRRIYACLPAVSHQYWLGCWSRHFSARPVAACRWPGAGIMEADDRKVATVFHSPTAIPPSALDKPSIMKRYHRRRTYSHNSPRRSPTLHDTRFVECQRWNGGWTVKTVVTWRSLASMIPACLGACGTESRIICIAKVFQDLPIGWALNTNN